MSDEYERKRIKDEMADSIVRQLNGKENIQGSQYILHELNEHQLRQVLSFVRSFN